MRWQSSAAASRCKFEQKLLLRRSLRFDLVNHDGDRAASLIERSSRIYLLSGKGKQLRVLPAGRRRAGDGPVDGAVFRKNHKLRSGVRTSDGALLADGLVETFREGTRGVKDIAFDRHRRRERATSQYGSGQYKQKKIFRSHREFSLDTSPLKHSGSLTTLRGDVGAPPNYARL